MSSPAPISARRRVLLALVTIAVLSIGTVPGGQTRQKRTTWRDYGGGPDNARYVELDEINKGTLGRLDVAWTYQTRDNLPYNFGPLVVDNVAYVLARNNSLVGSMRPRGRSSGCTRIFRGSRRAASITGRAAIERIGGCCSSAAASSKRSMLRLAGRSCLLAPTARST